MNTAALLAMFEQKLPAMETLNLSGCTCVTDSVIRFIVKACPKLNGLNVRGCYQLTNDFLTVLADCSNLQSLNLSGCIGLSDLNLIFRILRSNQLLRYLNISGAGFTPPDTASIVKCKVEIQGLEVVTDQIQSPYLWCTIL
jgi:hypothetical protein